MTGFARGAPRPGPDGPTGSSETAAFPDGTPHHRMFESLSQRLSSVFSGLTGRGRLTEKNMEDGLSEVRAALLEADVHFRVAKDLVDRVRRAADGQKVLESVTAGQMLVKLFHDELVEMMTDEGEAFVFERGRPTVILLAGLQGSGKTTTCAKLGVHLRDQRHRKPLLVAADIQRPAAVDQLKTLGAANDLPVFHEPGLPPEKLAERAVAEARRTGRDTVLVDTAGRLHIDAELMDELKRIVKKVQPDTTFLVCDAMTGQDAVRSASAFQETLPLDGVVLTKLDGDSRGGAALSVRHVTGAPVRFVGTGEKVADLAPFHADRLVSRILGMGDVVSLVEKAQGVIDEKEAEQQMQRMLDNRFTLDDMLGQFRAMKKMGSVKDLMSHLPGMPAGAAEQVDDKQLDRTQAIMTSMTAAERKRPDVIDLSRKRRIARGSGTSVKAVDGLLKQYQGMQKMMKQLKGGGLMSRLAGKLMPGMGGGAPDMSEVMSGMGAGGPAAGGGRATPGRRTDLRKSRKAERKRRKQGRKGR